MLYDIFQTPKYHNSNTPQYITTYSKDPLDPAKNYLGGCRPFCPVGTRHQFKYFEHTLINNYGP